MHQASLGALTLSLTSGRVFCPSAFRRLVQDLIAGTRFEMKSESLSTAMGLVDKACEKGKHFFR
jgi:hypothetical protein